MAGRTVELRRDEVRSRQWLQLTGLSVLIGLAHVRGRDVSHWRSRFRRGAECHRAFCVARGSTRAHRLPSGSAGIHKSEGPARLLGHQHGRSVWRRSVLVAAGAGSVPVPAGGRVLAAARGGPVRGVHRVHPRDPAEEALPEPHPVQLQPADLRSIGQHAMQRLNAEAKRKHVACLAVHL